jgi:hypothetical protein
VYVPGASCPAGDAVVKSSVLSIVGDPGPAVRLKPPVVGVGSVGGVVVGGGLAPGQSAVAGTV